MNHLEFLRICGSVKNVKRQGWVDSGIPEPESVADHMYRMAMCCFLIEDRDIDKTKCMKIALVHDLAEAIVGDITPHQNIPKAEKHRLEMAALKHITGLLGDHFAAAEILQLWEEYEAGQSGEAKYVKDFDKFDMVAQAFEYEKAHSIHLQRFFTSTEGKFHTDLVKGWVNALYEQRASRSS
eukprot:GILJ01011673.1.p1 GENE.GILJ01011673.1~~GILJ01011673.1.p1  ORF type:complete len:182 (-),score=24.07 GILJ01011673.1:384-929(-)